MNKIKRQKKAHPKDGLFYLKVKLITHVKLLLKTHHQ